MGTILRIFRDDIRSVGRRFFALAIIVAISGLPALYAWVNIYANFNPYANTGDIPIAVASVDPGIDLEDGSHVNMTDEVFDDLRKSDKIAWQFPDSAKEAIEGVESGKYYAAIVFENNFTYNMYHIEQALLDQKAPITFYENAKKNAVAAKIAETAAENVQESIETKYLETVFGIIFDETNAAADELSGHDAADTVISQLKELRDTLRSYDSAISAFTSKSAGIHSGIASAEGKLAKTREEADRSAADAADDLAKARSSLVVLQKALEEREGKINKEVDALEKALDKIIDGELTPEKKQEALKRLNTLKADVEGLLAFFPESGTGVIKAIRTTLLRMLDTINDIEDALNSSTGEAGRLKELIAELRELSRVSLASDVSNLISSMDRTLELMEPLMSSMSEMLDSLDPVLDGADATVSDLNASLLQMQKLFRATADKVDGIIKKVEAVSEDERLALLAELLGGDPEEYAKFFSALVNVEVEEVYSVASYGAAMAPFYSVLAIWVGGVILVSILKTHVDRKKYPGITESQAFFGRFLLFFLIGQVQAAVIITGDIFLLHCEPVHPGFMYLAAGFASFVFVLLIYALTLSFGDIGKAIVVIIMVVQIAGSSGSYPIEILPVVFAKIYRFFPFPYAINAIREALCGMYKYDYFIYIGELLLFAVVALFIGLHGRKPFIRMNEFVSEKIEETEVL